MVSLTLNAPTTTQNGGLTLSGDAPETWIMQWWYNDESTINTSHFTRSGTRWFLNLPIFSSSFSIYIRAANGLEVTDSIRYSFNSNNTGAEVVNHLNEFDEMGLELGYPRITGESNEGYKQRLLTAYTEPANSTRQGLAYNIEKRVGLPHMNPYFLLSSRYNLETKTTFYFPLVKFSESKVEVHFTHWKSNQELLDVDPVTGVAKPKELMMLYGTDSVEILNGGNRINPDFFTLDEELNEVYIDIERSGMDLDRQTLISYPYKKSLSYFYRESSASKERTVAEVKTWLQAAEMVTDHTNASVGAICWADGYYTSTTVEDESVVTLVTRSCMEDLFNNPVSNNYIRITESVDPLYLKAVSRFPNKGFFKASTIMPTAWVDLYKDPVVFTGSWFNIDALHSSAFHDKLRTGTSDRNIEHYANVMRRLTRMGIKNTLVDFDYWNSDNPGFIGDNFIRSVFDANLVDHIILTEEGSEQNISLNQRRYYAKILKAMQR